MIGLKKCEFTVPLEEENSRIDLLITRYFTDYTRTFYQKLLSSQKIFVNDNTVTKNYKVKAGDKIEFSIDEPVEIDVKGEDISLDIVYEDNDLIVINKPKGIVVHPAPGNPDHTLVNALIYHCKGSLSGIGGKIRPGIVHRIDKDTSGLIVVAKNDAAHLSLSKQLKDHTLNRTYRCVVYGNLKNDEGIIDAPIGRHESERKKMAVTSKNSKPAVTRYRTLQRFYGFTYVELKLETGRTHQIRVHMAKIGHPVAGDPVYGPKKTIEKLHGQCLHAMKIGFIHPTTGIFMEFTTELPDYFTSFLSTLQKMS